MKVQAHALLGDIHGRGNIIKAATLVMYRIHNEAYLDVLQVAALEQDVADVAQMLDEKVSEKEIRILLRLIAAWVNPCR